MTVDKHGGYPLGSIPRDQLKPPPKSQTKPKPTKDNDMTTEHDVSMAAIKGGLTALGMALVMTKQGENPIEAMIEAYKVISDDGVNEGWSVDEQNAYFAALFSEF